MNGHRSGSGQISGGRVSGNTPAKGASGELTLVDPLEFEMKSSRGQEGESRLR